ncbi:hypothetical protein M0802_012227 [Mischocyttarus mexicanus]|nr:hypothetical protein M0802_012227 [Mischocyttarus mexicanus]
MLYHFQYAATPFTNTQANKQPVCWLGQPTSNQPTKQPSSRPCNGRTTLDARLIDSICQIAREYRIQDPFVQLLYTCLRRLEIDSELELDQENETYEQPSYQASKQASKPDPS